MRKVSALLFLFLLLAASTSPFILNVLATTETRYMGSSLWDVGAPNRYWNTTQVGASTTVTINIYDGNVVVTQYFAFRLYLNHTDKSLTEVTSGITTVASGSSVGLKSGTWSCPQTTMVSTDKLQLLIYGGDSDPPSTLLAQFLAAGYDSWHGLLWTLLNSASWTFYLYLVRTYSAGTKLTTYSFGFSSSTYSSRVEGIKHDESTSQAITETFQQLASAYQQFLGRKKQLWSYQQVATSYQQASTSLSKTIIETFQQVASTYQSLIESKGIHGTFQTFSESIQQLSQSKKLLSIFQQLASAFQQFSEATTTTKNVVGTFQQLAGAIATTVTTKAMQGTYEQTAEAIQEFIDIAQTGTKHLTAVFQQVSRAIQEAILGLPSDPLPILFIFIVVIVVLAVLFLGIHKRRRKRDVAER